MSTASQSVQGEVQFVGTLERIIYLSDETHYCIGEFRAEEHTAPITIAGTLPGVQCGETLAIGGQWVTHPKHGRQFKVSDAKSKLPSSVYGIRKYLGSGLVPGIGKGYANKIVDHFGSATLKIISEESARLREVPGIGKQRAKSIKKAWDSQAALRDVMLFLKTYGVGTATCLRLVREYGNEAKRILEHEPYRVASEVRGIGFKTADKIALNLGFPNDSAPRIDAGILFAMDTFAELGHTCCMRDVLLNKCQELLDTDIAKIEERLAVLIHEKSLMEVASGCYQLPFFSRAEASIAGCVANIKEATSSLPSIIAEKALVWAEEKAGFTFAEAQRAGVHGGITSKLSIITGGPGTGKTTILRAIVDILRAKKCRIILAAPTGRAAQRMQESTRMHAQTIHRLLQYDAASGGFVMDEMRPLQGDCLIIDEASMLDTKLAASLFKAIPVAAHVILVGDVYQLPSVGAGNVLKDLIASGYFSVTRLDKIFRQREESSIVSVAHNILQGKAGVTAASPDLSEIDPKCDFHFIKTTEPEACVRIVKSLCQEWVPRWYGHYKGKMETQVLAPMHKGSAGIAVLNQELRGTSSKGPSLSLGHTVFSPGNRVIQLRNNYDKNIFNGDLGVIESICTESGSCSVCFGREVVELERMEMGDLALAYAISIHKSQGSEFPVVVIPLLKQHFVMLQRNLIYTAITRGRKKVFVVGDPVAYAMAVKQDEGTERLTYLKERLG